MLCRGPTCVQSGLPDTARSVRRSVAGRRNPHTAVPAGRVHRRNLLSPIPSIDLGTGGSCSVTTSYASTDQHRANAIMSRSRSSRVKGSVRKSPPPLPAFPSVPGLAAPVDGATASAPSGDLVAASRQGCASQSCLISSRPSRCRSCIPEDPAPGHTSAGRCLWHVVVASLKLSAPFSRLRVVGHQGKRPLFL